MFVVWFRVGKGGEQEGIANGFVEGGVYGKVRSYGTEHCFRVV